MKFCTFRPLISKIKMDDEVKIKDKLSSEVVTGKSNKETADVEEPLSMREDTKSSSEASTNVESGSEVITIVAQENDGELIIYEENGESILQTENANSECVQACDLTSASEADNNSQKKEVGDGSDVDDRKEEKAQDNEPKDKEEHSNVNYKEQNGKNENVNEVFKVVNDNNALCEKISENAEENQLKNYRNVILEDWEVEVSHVENHESVDLSEPHVVAGTQITKVVDNQQSVNCNTENCTIVEVKETNASEVNTEIVQNDQTSISEDQKENSSATLENEILKLMVDTKVDSLKYSKSISKNDIVKILDESTERVVKPIVTGKDLFFSIELTKRLNQKLLQNRSLKNSEAGEKNNACENEAFNNNNTVDDRQKIVDILEADEIKDWKSTPSKSNLNSKENGNDMEISKAIKIMEEGNSNEKAVSKPQKRTSMKKLRTMDKELERTIALQQLREEFPSTRKRTRTMKKINHIPFLASTVLEKALTSPEVTTALKPGPPKRRPCYLPDDKSDSKSSENNDEEKNTEGMENVSVKSKKIKSVSHSNTDGNPSMDSKTENKSDVIDLQLNNSENTSIPNTVVKTYSVKRKSTDTENNIKSTLETIAAVTKALCESAEETSESKPKKQKTVAKSEAKIKKKNGKKKTNVKVGGGKRNLELEKLLGDEGAVRMLYETQHKESNLTTPKKSKVKTTTGLKKDLVLKTKLVKNAVMRLSGVGTEGIYLRGKRFSKVANSDIKSEPLFASTPNIVLYKPKKKQRAEASRILYRHSSSESFDSSEGYRRTSFDGDGLNVSAKEGSSFNSEKVEDLNSTVEETEKLPPKSKPKKSEVFIKKRLNRLRNAKRLTQRKEIRTSKDKGRSERISTDSLISGGPKLNLSNVPVRKSSRPRMISKKYSIWSSTSMDSLSVESLGLKKLKKASAELGKKLNCKEFTILQYDNLVQVILNPVSTFLKNSFNFEVGLKHWYLI